MYELRIVHFLETVEFDHYLTVTLFAARPFFFINPAGKLHALLALLQPALRFGRLHRRTDVSAGGLDTLHFRLMPLKFLRHQLTYQLF